jgi:hypothetical protein
MSPMNRVREFFKVYHRLLFSGFGASGFLSFRFMGTFEVRGSEATVRDLFFKTQNNSRTIEVIRIA